MSEYILKIGKSDGAMVNVGKAKKAILIVRDALRKANVEADVFVKPSPAKKVD